MQETTIKLTWIKEIVGEIEPRDPELAPHLDSVDVLTTVLRNLQAFAFEGKDAKLARHAVAVLQSVLNQVQMNAYM